MNINSRFSLFTHTPTQAAATCIGVTTGRVFLTSGGQISTFAVYYKYG